MQDKPTDLLIHYRDELAHMDAQPWSKVEAWVSKVTPLILRYWPEQSDEFKKITALPSVQDYSVYVGTYRNDPIRQAQCDEINERSVANFNYRINSNAENTKLRIKGFIDGVIDLSMIEE